MHTRFGAARSSAGRVPPRVPGLGASQMKNLDYRDAIWAAAVLAAATAAYFIFRTPEPARTGLDLLDLVCSPGAARAAAIEQHVADPLELSLPAEDLPRRDTGGGAERELSRAEVAAELRTFDALARGCSFSLEDWQIRDAPGGAAWLEGTLSYSDSQPLDLHGSRRPLRALFREVRGEQRLERVVVGPLERRLPEARP